MERHDGKPLAFRRTLKAAYNLPVRTEIHASEFLKHAPVVGMPKHIRLAILRNFLDELAKIDYISVTNVIIDKQMKPFGSMYSRTRGGHYFRGSKILSAMVISRQL